MKQLLAVLLVSLMSVLPLSTHASEAGQTPVDYYPYYLGAGAIGGALVFNFLTGGLDALPFVGSSAAYWEGPLAVNRVFAVTSAVLGMWLVDWSYKNVDLKKP
jgi:hypothetical protein